MQITDYDVNGTTSFRVERNDSEWGWINIQKFMIWLADEKNWFVDAENLLIIIPSTPLKWVEKVQSFVCLDSGVTVYNWQKLCKAHCLQLKDWFEDYANCFDEIEWEEPEFADGDDFDTINDAIRFRKAYGK